MQANKPSSFPFSDQQHGEPPRAGTEFPFLQAALRNEEPVENPDQVPDFHPRQTHIDWSRPRNNLHALKLFQEDVKAINEHDEGDCKRQILLALFRMSEHLNNPPRALVTWMGEVWTAIVVHPPKEDDPFHFRDRILSEVPPLIDLLHASEPPTP